jgi:hypothetical protein
MCPSPATPAAEWEYVAYRKMQEHRVRILLVHLRVIWVSKPPTLGTFKSWERPVRSELK